MSREQKNRPGFSQILDAWVPPDSAGEALGCVATTFTFSPNLFESECVARFVGLESEPSDGAAYLIEREEKLAQLLCAAVLVDQHHARGMRSLRWDLLSARPRTGILHAKVAVLLWSRCARLIVGSANLTEDGYRRNHEVFAVLDYHEESEAPLATLREVLEFLRKAAALSSTEGSGPAITRWERFLDRVGTQARNWGAKQPPHSLTKPRVIPVFTAPWLQDDALSSLGKLWPGNSPPERAYVLSPFFDPPEAENRPASKIWKVLRQRGAAEVEYDCVVEEIPGEKALFVRAPESIVKARPSNSRELRTVVKRLVLDQGRQLHAKCLWLENDDLTLSMIGSSNFTSAGLAVGKIKNIEANLAFVVGTQASATRRALFDAWPDCEDIPESRELRWQPSEDRDDSAGEAQLLPPSFGDVRFGVNEAGRPFIEMTFVGSPPSGWQATPDGASVPFATEAQWRQAGSPEVLRLEWDERRPPVGFEVRWTGATNPAWWPVNIVDANALPPPPELKDLSLEVLIEILTSSKPIHKALSEWLSRRAEGTKANEERDLDPHRRVDTSSFLLQRTRRISWALAGLRKRLEQPVASEQALEWRLRGPVGVRALTAAISRESRSDAERHFFLAELCLELGRVEPQVQPGTLKASEIEAALRSLVAEIRESIPAGTLSTQPDMEKYVKAVFREALR